MVNTAYFNIETLSQVIEQKNKELSELRKRIRKQLEKDLVTPSNGNKTTYNAVKFFLSLGDTDVDLDLIVFCICDSCYLDDFCNYRCKHSFIPYLTKFNVLIQLLRDIYINC